MTPEICLCSIPHTGTRFTAKLFTDRRPHWHVIGLNGRPNPTPTVFEGHIIKAANMKYVRELARRMPVVIPLRHPYRVEQSWLVRRIEVFDDLWECWDNVFTLDDELGDGVTFLPIDAAPVIREQQLEILNEVCGVRFDPDWSDVVNSKARTNELQLEDIAPSAQCLGVAKHPLIERFYGRAT